MSVRACRGLLGLAMVAGALAATGCATPGGEREFWAVRCATYHGPDQYQQATALAEALKTVEGLKPELFDVLFDEDGAYVTYGRYERTWDVFRRTEVFRPDPQPDIELIQSLSYDQVTRPFAQARLHPLPAPAVGNPEWNAEDIDGYWSLQVAVFYNTDAMRSRRQAAADYCRILREQGEEAYYHHGPSVSAVMIGAFPREAVQSEQRTRFGVGGRRQTAVNRIMDPRLASLMTRFPHNLENGHRVNDVIEDQQTKEKRRRPRPSVLVVLPRAERAEAEQDQLGGMR
jgi:hypothetical protein